MGHRANYAILEDGELTLFYSHWGALTVPEDVFWGPEHAETFIREQDPVEFDNWLDDVWGEGGVALNKDTRHIALFGGETLGVAPLRTPFVRLMTALWESQGWTVVWADAGMPAIAAGVGVDPTVATAEPLPPVATNLEELGSKIFDNDTGEYSLTCLITTIQDGEFRHLAADQLATGMLANGLDLLQAIEVLPDLDGFIDVWRKPEYFGDEPWGLGDEFTSSIIIDFDHKSVSFRELYANPSALGFLSMFWPQWEIARFEGTVESHFRRLDLKLPPALTPLNVLPELSEVELDDDSLMTAVANKLLSSDRVNPAEMVRQILDDEEDVWVNPHALRDAPQIALDKEMRSQIFGQALAAMTMRPSA